MTESEWLSCTDPQAMLNAVRNNASARKGRLFICGCLRRIWELVCINPEWRKLVEIGEQFVESQVSEDEMYEAENSARAIVARDNPSYITWRALHWVSYRDPYPESLTGIAEHGEDAAATKISLELLQQGRLSERKAAKKLKRAEERKGQCDLTRCIFGNPFRTAIIVPAWLAWNDGTVPKLAQAIYEERRFADLPILADALEEAGCDNADILAHCRTPAEHVRGCWVVDALLGKT
jgi:hypothetical protein